MDKLSVRKKFLLQSAVAFSAIVVLLAMVFQVGGQSRAALESVQAVSEDVARAGRDIAKPLGLLRERSLTLVLAPDAQTRDAVTAEIDPLIADLDAALTAWRSTMPAAMDDDAQAMMDEWGWYKEHLAQTRAFIAAGRREAAFVNVVGPEREQFTGLSGRFSALLALVSDHSAQIYDEQLAAIRSVTFASIGLGVGFFLLAALTAYWIGRDFIGSISGLTGAMARLVDGDDDVDIPGEGRKDEMGAMARAVMVFRDTQREMRALHEERAHARTQEAQSARASRIADLTSSFESRFGDVVGAMAQTAEQLDLASQSMVTASARATARTDQIAAAARTSSDNVQTVAMSAEELSGSFLEIGDQVRRSSDAAEQAEEATRRSGDQVRELATSGARIGEVVALINGIAEQTNLLALNATIEAARAGDAGKGFAVVANEVKTLANQTAKATEDITAQVASIQNATQSTVEAIDLTMVRISTMTEIAGAVAAAMEDQNIATREIVANIQKASRATAEIAESVDDVSDAARETDGAAHRVKSDSESLHERAGALRGVVDQFLSAVRAA